METDEIEEGLENLAQKRSYIYDSKKESLRREIGQLRDFFSSMEKEREILECQVKATQALCRRKLVKAEKELQQAQARLRETQNEAAVLLEGKHQEMERLQKERDDCKAQADHLAGECDFVKGYTHYLEEKICLLIAKLHEYHEDLQKKTEEIVETRSRAVSELEWVKQSMLNFEKNLLEFHNTNSQFSSDKENLIQKLQGLKQLEAPTSEMNDLRVKKASAYTLERDRLERECFSRNFTQPSQETLESNSEPAHVEEGPLDEDSKHSSWSRSACSCNWISDEDRPAQQQRDHRIVVPRLF